MSGQIVAAPVSGVAGTDVDRLEEIARRIRVEIVRTVHLARAGHMGGSLSERRTVLSSAAT